MGPPRGPERAGATHVPGAVAMTPDMPDPHEVEQRLNVYLPSYDGVMSYLDDYVDTEYPISSNKIQPINN